LRNILAIFGKFCEGGQPQKIPKWGGPHRILKANCWRSNRDMSSICFCVWNLVSNRKLKE